MQSISWVLVYLNKPAGFDVSSLTLVLISLFPWFAIWAVYSNRSSSLRWHGFYPSSLGVILFGCISVALSMANFNPILTSTIYGGTVKGIFLNGSRSVLPGFPGIVSGGVFCGLGIVCLIGEVSKKPMNWQSGWRLLPLVLLANGIRVTDARGAAGVSLLFVAAGIVGIFSNIKTSDVKQCENGGRFGLPTAFIGGSIIAPFVATIMLPILNQINLSPNLVALLSQVVRTNYESIFSFSGRCDIWLLAWDTIRNDGLKIVSFHPLGEFGSGISDVLFAATEMPGTALSAHSHNCVFNYYFSFGTFGILVMAFLLYKLFRTVTSKTKSSRLTDLQFPLTGFMLLSVFESLFSIQYLYFGLYFTLLSLDIYSESRRSGS